MHTSTEHKKCCIQGTTAVCYKCTQHSTHIFIHLYQAAMLN